MAGLTSTGFNKKTLVEALAELNQRVIDVFGAVNTESDSVFGQYNAIISEIVSDLWELAELVYQSQYSLSAVGSSLDAVAELTNVSRLGATSSSALAILLGTPATVVPLGTQFTQSGTSEIFSSNAAATIANTSMLKCVFSNNDPATAPHTLTIVSATYGTDAFSSALATTAIAVLNDLASQINTLGNHKALVDATLVTLTITNVLTSDTEVFEISTFGATMDQDEIWTPVTVEADNTGVIEVPAESIQTILTPVSGLTSVDNLGVGTKGRALETDDDFRLRRKLSLSVIGAGTVPSIEARLVADIEAVTSAAVATNRGDTTDANGRPPHSFEAVVSFSPDTTAIQQSIADKIWAVKPAGIQTFGGLSQIVTDSNGDPQQIFFSKPILKYLHINCEITLNPEETFPVGGEAVIAQALADFGNLLTPGDDVIRQRFFNSIYTAVPGVQDVTLFELATTENPGDTPSSLTTDTILTETESGLYLIDQAGGGLIGSGVVSGMVVALAFTGTPITSVSAVLSQEDVRVHSDIFNVGDTIEFGGFGAVNIGINANEISNFDAARITVTVV